MALIGRVLVGWFLRTKVTTLKDWIVGWRRPAHCPVWGD
jgi:hypothetical protein